MNKNFFEESHHIKLILILAGMAYFMLMFGNSFVSLTHPDEVFYTQTAKEMVMHKSWLVPMIFDVAQFEKPILFFWMSAVTSNIFGFGPFVARFWPGFFGILGVGIIYWISWILFERKRLAFLSGFMLMSSFIYLALSRAVLTDVVFSVMIAISLGFFYLAYKSWSKKKENKTACWGVVLCAVFMGLAVLTKGLLGVVCPLTTMLAFLFYKKDLSFIKRKATLIGFLVFLAVALPWHILMYLWYDQMFLHEYFYNVHVRRLLEAEHGRLDNWYFYFGLMFAGILPWSFFEIPAAYMVYKKFKTKAIQRDKFAFLLFWIVGVFIYIEPAHSKLASYIFPVFPAIIIMVAYYIDEKLSISPSEKQGLRVFKMCGYSMSFFIFGAAIAAIIYGKKYPDVVTEMGPIYVFVSLLILGAGAIFLFNKTRQHAKMIFSYASVTVTLLITLFLARPYIEPWVSCKDISEVFKKIDQSDTIVIASKFYVRGVRFYTDRKMAVIDINGSGFFSPHPIPFMNTDKMVLDLLASQAVTYAVVKEGNVEDLVRITQGLYTIDHLEGIGGKFILRISKK